MRFALRFLVVCVSMFAAAVPAAAGIGDGQWSRPVNGPVVRGFDPPSTPFGPGHLGVDFAAAPGTPVHAAGDGVVVFAGHVGAALHVVVRHSGDIRTSYSFLLSASVVNGQRLARGVVVGTSGGTGAGHGPGLLHFGVRVGATYVDPILLFEPVDLTAVVHLAAPRHGIAAVPGAVGERDAIVDALRVDARRPAPPPAWWGETRAEPARPPTPRVAATKPAAPAATPGSGQTPPVAVAVIGTTLAVAGTARVRRRRPDGSARVPTTLLPGPVGPGLGTSLGTTARQRPDHT